MSMKIATEYDDVKNIELSKNEICKLPSVTFEIKENTMEKDTWFDDKMIRIENEEQNERVQKMLFDLGYDWVRGKEVESYHQIKEVDRPLIIWNEHLLYNPDDESFYSKIIITEQELKDERDEYVLRKALKNHCDKDEDVLRKKVWKLPDPGDKRKEFLESARIMDKGTAGNGCNGVVCSNCPFCVDICCREFWWGNGTAKEQRRLKQIAAKLYIERFGKENVIENTWEMFKTYRYVGPRPSVFDYDGLYILRSVSYKHDSITKKGVFYDIDFVNIKTGKNLTFSCDPGREYFSIVEDCEKDTDTKEPEITEPLNGWYKIKTWDEVECEGVEFLLNPEYYLPRSKIIYIDHNLWRINNGVCYTIKPWMIKEKLSDKDSKVMDISRIKATVVKEPLKEFKAGHWYRYIGSKQCPDYFVDIEEMAFVLGGKPLKCKKGSGRGADFGDGRMWLWNLEDFEEIRGESVLNEVIHFPKPEHIEIEYVFPFIGKRQRVINALRGNKE